MKGNESVAAAIVKAASTSVGTLIPRFNLLRLRLANGSAARENAPNKQAAWPAASSSGHGFLYFFNFFSLTVLVSTYVLAARLLACDFCGHVLKLESAL